MNSDQIVSIYGDPGSNLVKCRLPYKMKIAWDLGITIQSFACHSKVVHHLENIFVQTLDHYGLDGIADNGLDIFGGCFNIRQMRNGTKLSVHSWGLAVDIDPLNNQLTWGKGKAKLSKPELNKFWDIVYKNKGYSLGMEKNYDWMHFQFIEIK